MSNHTKGKWTWYWANQKVPTVHIILADIDVAGNNGYIIAELYGPDAEANAKHICALHNKMVDGLNITFNIT